MRVLLLNDRIPPENRSQRARYNGSKRVNEVQHDNR